MDSADPSGAASTQGTLKCDHSRWWLSEKYAVLVTVTLITPRYFGCFASIS
jgi:hypothetical protein